MSFWNQRTFCVITGASRGIGKCMAVEFSKKVSPGSVFLIIARSAHALEATKSAIVLSGTDGIKVVTAALDLGNTEPSDYLRVINLALTETGTSANDFDHAILVHNAGSLGNITIRAIEVEDQQELRDYYQFNIYSMMLLTSQFFKVFHDSSKQRSIIQISSHGAVEPYKTWSLYCAGKAARDMFIRSIAKEDPTISCLNYAPGLVDTDIYTEAESRTGDAELAKDFKDSKSNGGILSPIETIRKLVKILAEKKYVMGEHISYNDVP